MDNIVPFPHKDTVNTYRTHNYNLDKITVNLNGFDCGVISASDWSYNVSDAIRDIQRDRLKQELDNLYEKIKDSPECWDIVIASIKRLNSLY